TSAAPHGTPWVPIGYDEFMRGAPVADRHDFNACAVSALHQLDPTIAGPTLFAAVVGHRRTRPVTLGYQPVGADPAFDKGSTHAFGTLLRQRHVGVRV